MLSDNIMKNSLHIVSILSILILFTSFNSDKSAIWKLEKSKNGIKVYSNIPEGESLKQIKTYTIVKSSLSSLIAILLDVPNYPSWIYNCSEGRIVKKINEFELIYYSISDVPWPIQNRDLVLHNKIHQNKKTKVVYSTSTPKLNLIPKIKGMVRIEDMYGEWKFSPLKNGFVLIEYNLKIDVGGKVPPWVINLFIEKGPYQSVLYYKETLKLEKYKNAELDFIVEPNN